MCILQVFCTLFIPKVITNILRGWCAIYECNEDTILTSGILTVVAAIIFSPWTFLDGTLGALLAQLINGKYPSRIFIVF